MKYPKQQQQYHDCTKHDGMSYTDIGTKEGKKLESKVNSHLILIANIIIIVVVRRRLLSSSILSVYIRKYINDWRRRSTFFSASSSLFIDLC